MLTEEKRQQLSVEGIHCAGCASTIEKTLLSSGAKDVVVDIARGNVSFVAPSGTSSSEYSRKIQAAGYKVREEGEVAPVWTTLEAKLIFCATLTAPLLLHMLLPWHVLHNPYFQCALASPVYLLGLVHFGRSAWRSLKARMPNMDVLIVTGITAAYFYSVYGTVLALGPDFLFYETAASITTLVLLGNYVEKRAVSQTTSAVEELTRMQPQTAKRVVSKDNQSERTELVPVDQVNIGDVLLAATGDKIPVDGVIIWGEGSLDEALLTGESLPVFKSLKDEVIAGTSVASGSIKFRASAVGDETALSQIIKMVLEARAKKPEIQRLSDRVAAVFTPIVFSIAVLTLIVSFAFLDIGFQEALIRGVAVLVIACPCAMGLATPTAVMVGIGRAAREGVLIKSAAALEKLAKVNTVIFDKTGTLTTGRFEISHLQVVDGDASVVRSALNELERHSSHPLAASIVRALSDAAPMSLTSITEEKGFGIAGTDDSGNTYKLGSWRIAEHATENLSHDLYLLKNGRLSAYLDLSDELKFGAARVVAQLHEQKIRTLMLSGDRNEKCLLVAQAIGIREFRSELLPEHKLEILHELQRGSVTAFVGDGINDAPSLARADVGISLSGATQVAVNSAEVVLLNGDLSRLLKALSLSRTTVATIKENLFWAFFYNTAAIPFAAAGYLSPIVAALAMAFSDLIVIGNSLRLRRRGLD